MAPTDLLEAGLPQTFNSKSKRGKMSYAYLGFFSAENPLLSLEQCLTHRRNCIY